MNHPYHTKARLGVFNNEMYIYGFGSFHQFAHWYLEDKKVVLLYSESRALVATPILVGRVDEMTNWYEPLCKVFNVSDEDMLSKFNRHISHTHFHTGEPKPVVLEKFEDYKDWVLNGGKLVDEGGNGYGGLNGKLKKALAFIKESQIKYFALCTCKETGL